MKDGSLTEARIRITLEAIVLLVLAVVNYLRAFFVSRHNLALEIVSLGQQLAVLDAAVPILERVVRDELEIYARSSIMESRARLRTRGQARSQTRGHPLSVTAGFTGNSAGRLSPSARFNSHEKSASKDYSRRRTC